jgi:hypothetical protein
VAGTVQQQHAQQHAQQQTQHATFEAARIFVRTLKLRGWKEWLAYSKSDQVPDNNPGEPDRKNRAKGWISLAVWLGYDEQQLERERQERMRPLSFEKARVFVRSLKLGSVKDWNVYMKSGKRPDNIPSRPDLIYRDAGYVSLPDWLGYGVGKQPKKMIERGSALSFEAARTFMRTLNLGSVKEWLAYCQSGKCPDNIPSRPDLIYRDAGYVSLPDWLGYEKKKRLSDFEKNLRALVRRARERNVFNEAYIVSEIVEQRPKRVRDALKDATIGSAMAHMRELGMGDGNSMAYAGVCHLGRAHMKPGQLSTSEAAAYFKRRVGKIYNRDGSYVSFPQLEEAVDAGEFVVRFFEPDTNAALIDETEHECQLKMQTEFGADACGFSRPGAGTCKGDAGEGKQYRGYVFFFWVWKNVRNNELLSVADSVTTTSMTMEERRRINDTAHAIVGQENGEGGAGGRGISRWGEQWSDVLSASLALQVWDTTGPQQWSEECSEGSDYESTLKRDDLNYMEACAAVGAADDDYGT